MHACASGMCTRNFFRLSDKLFDHYNVRIVSQMHAYAGACECTHTYTHTHILISLVIVWYIYEKLISLIKLFFHHLITMNHWLFIPNDNDKLKIDPISLFYFYLLDYLWKIIKSSPSLQFLIISVCINIVNSFESSSSSELLAFWLDF